MQECFKKNNKQFFTHTLINERKIKFVIYGLHPVPIDELKTELELKGIVPEIKKLNIKNLKFENQTIYLLYFTKDTNINLTEIRKTKALFMTITKTKNLVQLNVRTVNPLVMAKKITIKFQNV